MFPKVIRAGAGPHDLGSGDNKGDTLPELTAQPDVEPTISGNEDPRGQWGPITDDTDSGSDIVVRNTPYVQSLYRSFISTLTSSPRMRNMIAGVPSQITYSR